MKTFREIAKSPIGIGCGVLLLFACLGVAGVTGLFTQVNSTNGYQVNGTAGSSGQALCSNGTYYAVPCSMSGGTITGVTTTSPLTGGGSSGSVAIGMANSGVTAGSYLSPNVTIDAFGRITTAINGTGTTFTGSSGYQVLSSGLVLEFGHAPDAAGGAISVTFPVAFASSVYSCTATDNFGGSSRIVSVSNLSVTGFTINNDGSSNGEYWQCVGH